MPVSKTTKAPIRAQTHLEEFTNAYAETTTSGCYIWTSCTHKQNLDTCNGANTN